MSAFYFTLSIGTSGYVKDVVGGLNSTNKDYLYLLLDIFKFPGTRGCDNQMYQQR